MFNRPMYIKMIPRYTIFKYSSKVQTVSGRSNYGGKLKIQTYKYNCAIYS